MLDQLGRELRVDRQVAMRDLVVWATGIAVAAMLFTAMILSRFGCAINADELHGAIRTHAEQVSPAQVAIERRLTAIEAKLDLLLRYWDIPSQIKEEINAK